MPRKLPESLEEKQAKLRKETEDKIQSAIENLKSLGYDNITMALIMKETSLARSTLNKPHAQEVFKKNGIGKFKNIVSVNKSGEKINEREMINRLEKELALANGKIKSLEKKLDENNAKLNEYKLEAIESKQQLRETVGKFQALYEKVLGLGIEVVI